MELSIAIAGLITLFFLLYQCLLWSRAGKSKTKAEIKYKAPPEAGGAWPFIGHLHFLVGGGSDKLPHVTLSTMADKYGPIFTIRLGVHRALVVSNWKLAKELFTTFDVVVSYRPKLMAAKHLGYNYSMFGFSPYGAYWRDMRKLVSTELLSSRRLELLKNVRLTEIAESINKLYRQWEEKKDGSGRVLVEFKKWFGDLNLNVLLRMVVGKRFFGVSDHDEKGSRRWQELMREFFGLAGTFVVADALPYLGWLDIGGHEKKMKKIAKELDDMVGEWLEEHRVINQDKSRQHDFMDVMLSVVQGAFLKGQHDADTVIKSTCLSMIFGGSETTAVMLVWTVSLLLNNLHDLKKVQEELDLHVGRERQVKESDINNLVYLQAVVKETLRLYPAAPLSAFREFSEDSNIGGYNIPKGTRLIVNLSKLQKDPQVWLKDSSEFRPERFLTTYKNMDVKGKDFELIPFGAGRRICPGWNLGLHMLHLVLANLLHAFDLSTPCDELVDMTESVGLTNMKATPLDVLVSPRLSPSLYKVNNLDEY